MDDLHRNSLLYNGCIVHLIKFNGKQFQVSQCLQYGTMYTVLDTGSNACTRHQVPSANHSDTGIDQE